MTHPVIDACNNRFTSFDIVEIDTKDQKEYLYQKHLKGNFMNCYGLRCGQISS